MNIKVKTTIPGPKSIALLKKMDKFIGTANYAGLFGIVLEKGSGAYITDADGNTYLDFLSGASAAILGYGRKDLVKTYSDVALKMQHSCFVYSPNPYAIKLAEELVKLTPGNFEKRVLFGLTGSDSIDAAIKASRRYTGKPGIISFNNDYHGITGLAIQANGFPGIHKGLFMGKDFYFVDFPSNEKQAEKTIQDIVCLLDKHEIAAVITEPIQGDGGNVVPPPEFHKNLHALLKKRNVVYVVDEVQSGMGRSGQWYESTCFGVKPDIITSAKGITSGYAILSACIGRKEIIDSLTKVQNCYTMEAHGPSCAVASKVIEIIKKEKILESVSKMGSLLKNNLLKLMNKYEFVKDVRGEGLHIGMEVYDDKLKKPLGGLFALRLVEKGIYPGFFGPTNNVIRLHPPLIITKKQAELACKKIEEVCREWQHGKFPAKTKENYKKYCLGLGSE